MTYRRSHRIGDFNSLKKWLQPQLGTIRCVSFDVFDTLLARCIEPPDALQHRVATLLAAKIGIQDVGQVLHLRRETEIELRHAALADGLDHECHFDPLVEQWVTRLVGRPDSQLVDYIHETERALESLALSAKPGATMLLGWLREHGMRVIAVSDMYLSHDHLDALLTECGLRNLIDRIYVSSEFGLGKYSGRLHSKVLELEALSPRELVHIGDNLTSDMEAPASLDIRSVFFDEKPERLRRRHQSLSARMAPLGGVWRGRHFFEIVDYRMARDTATQEACKDFFHHYGAHVLGPAFSTFLLALIEKIDTVKPDKLFFLARDGYLFQKLYARWCELEPGRNWPEPVYVYASRRVVATASVADGLSHSQAMVALYNPKQQGLLSVLKTFGLPPEQFSELAGEHGFHDLSTPLTDWHDQRLVNFLADEVVQARIRPFGIAARDLLQKYFEQQGLFACTTAAIIDIGWNGTIQKFLHESFARRSDYPDIHGWYFAFVAAMHGDFGMGDRIEGLMLDARHGNPYERAPMDFEEVFEQAARSGEGTTLGYEAIGAGVIPILKDDSMPDRQSEIACNPLIKKFQSGVLDHLVHFHAAWRLTGYDAINLKPYSMALLERAVAYPTNEEVREISRLVHTEDFGHDHTLEISAAPIRGIDLLRPRKLYRLLKHRAWKFAAFARFRSGIPAWGFRLAYLLKHR